ncbi:MAG: STAS-like domain-containing protein [Bryobacterales bacterium]|nr:STAS-like domain-containing protein [Bryobacterales bacterium]
MTLSVAREFSKVPGPRSREEGPFSAEQFLDELLQPRFNEAEQAGQSLLVDLDGGCGYATAFLEESFGGLARRLSSPERVLRVLKFKSDEEPYLCDDVRRYVVEAETGAQFAQ